jgi:hypothetical protein
MSPALPELKQRNMLFPGMTKKDGVFSWLNGLNPRQFVPHRFKATYGATIS